MTIAYNPFAPEHATNPYPLFAGLLEQAAVIQVPEFVAWAVLGWEESSAVLKDRRFSADRRRATIAGMLPEPDAPAEVLDELELFRHTLLTLDAPDHTRLRGLVSKAFTTRMVEGLRPRIAAITGELLDRIAAGSEAELMADFADPLPVIVIAEMLGLPREDRIDLKRWSDDVATLLDPFPSPQALDRFYGSVKQLRAYFEEQFAHRRRRPGDDLITGLVQARDGADALDDDELFAMCVLLLGAGHETTTNLIGNAVVALLEHRAERRQLACDPALAKPAVEEFLRFDSPVQRTARVATEDCRVGDRDVAAGDLVVVILAAANRDPRRFTDPARLDLGRVDNRHLSFGAGVHYCLGAPLARLEAEIALPALLRRFPGLDGDTAGLEHKPSIVLRGPQRLPVQLG